MEEEEIVLPEVRPFVLERGDVHVGGAIGFLFSIALAWLLVNVPVMRWFAVIYLTFAFMTWLIYAIEWITRGRYPFYSVYGYVPRSPIFFIFLCVSLASYFVMLETLGIAEIGIGAFLPVGVWENLILIGVFVPFYEESLFLMILFPTFFYFLQRWIGRIPSLILASLITSFLFSFFHWVAYGQAIGILLALGIFRFITCVCASMTKDVSHGLLAHVIINVSGVIWG